MFSDELEMEFLDVSFIPSRFREGREADPSWVRNVPMGAAILVLVVSTFKIQNFETSSQRQHIRTKLYSMDPLGIVLLLGAVCSLFLVLQQGGTAWPWRSGKIIGLLFSFAALLVAFGILQWKLGERATIPLRLLRDRTVLSGSLFLASSNASSYLVSAPRRHKRFHMA